MIYSASGGSRLYLTQLAAIASAPSRSSSVSASTIDRSPIART